MISIFNEVFTLLTNTLQTYDNIIETGNVNTNKPSSYPFVSLEEIENRVYEQGSDSCQIENYAEVEYEVNIYTNNPKLKKSKGDAVANVVDNFFNEIGFLRTTRNTFQNADETIYRIIVRYHAIVSKDHTIYRR